MYKASTFDIPNNTPDTIEGDGEWGLLHHNPGPPVIIRKMAEGDIDNIMEIEKSSFIAPWTQKLFEETLYSPISMNLVMEEAGKIVGYIMLYSVQNEAHMMNIAIHPAYRRAGNAYRLIAHTIALLKKNNIDELFLEVREGNAHAINLYKKHGFKVIGKRRKYYSETNEDALIMQLSIKQ